MTILEPTEGWVNPFSTAPAIGRIVLYRADEGIIWPSIVSQVRAKVRGADLQILDPTNDAVTKAMEDEYGPISIQCHLTIFRPSAIFWKWCVEGTEIANWFWPMKGAAPA